MYYSNVSKALLERARNQSETRIEDINKSIHERFILSSEVIMYYIEDIMKITGWSRRVVQRLFNDPAFPSINYGKAKLVEAHALIAYLSVRRERETNDYWMKATEKQTEKTHRKRYSKK